MIKTQRIALAMLTGFMAAAGGMPARAEVRIDSVAGFDIGFSGLVQFDLNRFEVDGIDYRNDQDLRRAELVLGGERGDISWKLGYDAAGEKYLDNLIGFGAGPAKIKLGQFKQPNSLEELSSTKNNDFIAKAAATSAFAVSRRLGGSAAFSGNDWTVTASLFDGELTAGSDAGSGAAARMTFAPMNEKDRTLHFGLSAVRADLPGHTTRLRLRPNADLADIRPVDTGRIVDADEQETIGGELVWTRGPLKLQGEYFTSTVGRHGALASVDADAWYVSTVWNLTGEPWGYRSGMIRTPSPERAAAGMWQAGLRYDRADLGEGDFDGGTMRGLTLGVNYYWGSNWKLAANWVRVKSRRAGLLDEPDILEFRAQFHW